MTEENGTLLRSEPDAQVSISASPAAGGSGGARGRVVRRGLVLADLLGLALAFGTAALVHRSRATPTDAFALPAEFFFFLVSLPGWLLLAKLHGLYDRDEERASHGTVDDLLGVAIVLTIGTWLFLAVSWVAGIARPYPPKLILFWGLAILFVVSFRGAVRAYCRRLPSYVQNMVLVGGGEVGMLLARKLRERPEYGVNVVGYVDEQSSMNGDDDDEILYLGRCERLPEVVGPLGVVRAVVVFPTLPRERLVELVRQLRSLEVQVDIVPRLFELVAPSADVHSVQGLPMIGLPPLRAEPAARALKRAVRPRRRRPAAAAARAAARVDRAPDQARLARDGLLPPRARRRGRPALPGAQVPDDVRSRLARCALRGRPRGGRAPAHARRPGAPKRVRAEPEARRTTLGSPTSATSCAASRWTSSRSSSTSSVAR